MCTSLAAFSARFIAVLLGVGLYAPTAARTQTEKALPEFHPPKDAFVVGFREAATHRSNRLLDPLHFYGGNNEVNLFLHVDSAGQVTEIHGIGAPQKEVEDVSGAAYQAHYAPFLRSGQPTDAWIQDKFYLEPKIKTPSRVTPFPPITDLAKVRMRLTRSGCYGTCPAYMVEITGDGKVVYEGKYFVSIPGIHTAQISQDAVKVLIDQFRSANFFSLDDEYIASITDCPSYSISFSVALGHKKTVVDYVGRSEGMPPAITELEDAVDKAADTARWVSASPATIAAMKDAKIGFTSPQAATILSRALEIGDVTTAKSLLTSGVSLAQSEKTPDNVITMEGPRRPLLVQAATSYNKSARSELIAAVLASPASKSDIAAIQEALASATKDGRVDLADQLIDAGADTSKRFGGDQKLTYLMLALESGIWDMIEDALARPHDIHAVDNKNHSALQYAFWTSPQNEDIFPIVDRLLADGADTSELDRAMADACYPNWLDGMLARGAHINARNADGNTALFDSCTVEGVQLFLDRGLDPTIRNNAGQTAVEAVYQPSHGDEDSRAAVIRRYLEKHSQH